MPLMWPLKLSTEQSSSTKKGSDLLLIQANPKDTDDAQMLVVSVSLVQLEPR